jgi:hypothetical protein
VATATLLPSLALAAVFALACAAAGLLPPSISTALAASAGPRQLHVQPLLVFTVVAAAAVGGALGYLLQPAGNKAAAGLQKPAAAAASQGAGSGGSAAAGSADWKNTPLGAAGIPPSPGGQQVLMVYTGSTPAEAPAGSSPQGGAGTGQGTESQPAQQQDTSAGDQDPVQPPLSFTGGYGKGGAQASLKQQQKEDKSRGNEYSQGRGQGNAGQEGSSEGGGPGGSGRADGPRPSGSAAALPGHQKQAAALSVLQRPSLHHINQLCPSLTIARHPLRMACVPRVRPTGAARVAGERHLHLV